MITVSCTVSKKPIKSTDILNFNVLKVPKIGLFEYLVPPGGLEPPRPKATDFESVVSTISPRWHLI